MEFSGANLVIKFVTTGGTADLSADERSVTYTPSVKFATATAGSDAFEAYLATVKDTQVSVAAVAQSGGTVVEDILAAGNFGTLTIQPEGTATGKRKYTIPAFSKGAVITFPYDDTVTIACDFQGSGTPTIGVN